MTANAFLTDKETCIEAGMNEYMSKPLKIEVIDEILKRYLNKNR